MMTISIMIIITRPVELDLPLCGGEKSKRKTLGSKDQQVSDYNFDHFDDDCDDSANNGDHFKPH